MKFVSGPILPCDGGEQPRKRSFAKLRNANSNGRQAKMPSERDIIEACNDNLVGDCNSRTAKRL